MLAVFELVFVFRLGARPPQSTEGAGGRPLTERSKRDGPTYLQYLGAGRGQPVWTDPLSG